MVNTFLLVLMNAFAGTSQGISGTNTNSVVIKGYLGGTAPENYILSLMTSSQLIGATVGSFSCSFLLDKLGPKRLVIISGILGALTQGLGIIPIHWAFMFAMRVLNGIPAAIIATVTSPWLVSISTIKQRGYIGVTYQIFVCFGIIVNAIVLFSMTIPEKDSNYWIALIATVFVFIMCTVIAFLVPDPQFSCGKKGRSSQDQEAAKSQEDAVAQVSWKELFTNKKYRRSLLLGAFFAIGQQFSGINAVINYATVTFSDYFTGVSADLSSNYGTLIISSVNWLSTLFVIPLINRLGRRLLSLIGFVIDCATLIVLAIIYIINNANPNKAVLIIASIVYLIGFELGPGPCYYVCLSESFPREIKGRCLGFAFTLIQLSYLIVVLTFPFFEDAVYGAYIMYFVVTLISTIVLWVTLVETKGRTFEEIQAIMTGESAPASKEPNDVNHRAAVLAE